MTTNITDRVFTVRETRDALKLGHTKIYELLSKGEIVSFHIGRSRRIKESAIEDFITRQLAEEAIDQRGDA